MIETPVAAPAESVSTAASRAAEQNWNANLLALAPAQPALVDAAGTLGSVMEWIHARDGSLSAIDGDRWWGGCSVPRRSAEFMFAKADLSGSVLCFLLPWSAAQLRVLLDRMTPSQALLALVPNLQILRMILACEDFSTDFARHRLYFAWGEQWEKELDRLFGEHPGLPLPSQFVRPVLADASPADALIEPAQRVFAATSTRRANVIRDIRQAWRGGRPFARICLVAPMQFRLWDEAGVALAAALNERPNSGQIGDVQIRRFNSDDPASASPLALASAAAECDAMVTPNSARGDLPDLLPIDMPWATWITAPRIPSAEKTGPRDTLIVADPVWKPLAIKAGWPADRVLVGNWPGASWICEESNSPGVFEMPPAGCLAIIADTRKLDPPPRVEEYSSHRLLWEAIAHELLANPFALGPSPEIYLSRWLTKAKVSDEGLDRRLFVDGLIVHAYQQGLARLLLKEGLPLRLYGAGWDAIDDFHPHAVGRLATREQFNRAIARATALVHVWPASDAHPIDACGKTVVRARSGRDVFLQQARAVLSGIYAPPCVSKTPITGNLILGALSVQG